MAIPVQSIVTRLIDLTIDYDRGDEARWTDAELIRWINDFRIALVTRSPNSCAKTAAVTLAAGSHQTIPEDGVALFDITRNIKANGQPGKAIRRTDRQDLDDAEPDWHMQTPRSEVIHYTYDDRNPKEFYAYPPAVAGTKVEMVYPAIAPEVDSLNDILDIGLESLEAAVNYVAYRAKSKDSQYANAAEAAGYYQAFEAALGLKQQAQTNTSPNQPGNSV